MKLEGSRKPLICDMPGDGVRFVVISIILAISVIFLLGTLIEKDREISQLREENVKIREASGLPN